MQDESKALAIAERNIDHVTDKEMGDSGLLMAVADTVRGTDKKVDQIRSSIDETRQEIKAQVDGIRSEINLYIGSVQRFRDLEPPAYDPIRMTTRKNLVRLVNAYAAVAKRNHRDVWNDLYRDFKKATGIDLVRRAKNRGISPIEAGGQDDILDLLYKFAYQQMAPVLTQTEVA